MEKRHNIKVVARRTGLSQHVIRIWERRYDAVVPERTDTNRRLYSEEDIERLMLLKRLTETGASISQIAALGRQELLDMLGVNQLSTPSAGLTESNRGDIQEVAARYLKECLEAVRVFDSRLFEQRLMEASVTLGQVSLLERLLLPLLESIGEMWSRGEIKVAHEHLASSVIRSLLGAMVAASRVESGAPSIVVTTPSGQHHEFGALMAAVTAAAVGWRVLYLGPNMPAVDIASAVQDTKARAVALSVVYPPDDPQLVNELRMLRQLLPEKHYAMLVGGRSAGSYQPVLNQIDGSTVAGLAELREHLDNLRSRWIFDKLDITNREATDGQSTN